MEVQTDSERVRTSRKMVLEFLGSSVDISLAGPAAPDGSIAAYAERYGADPSRYGPAAAPAAAGERDAHEAGHHHAPPAMRRPRPSPSRPRSTTTSTSATTRSASSATSASRPAARTPRTRSRSPSPAAASTPASRPSRPSRCRIGLRLLRQLHRRLPDRRADVQVRVRHARGRDVGRVAQTVTETICPYCGVGCAVELHVQDNRIVKVTSPLDSSVTDGHLCIKGRFGFEFVNERPKGGSTSPER